MRHIIVPTDFSAASVNAAFYAVEIARRVQAGIVLLHAVVLPVTVSEVPLPPDSYELTIAEANQSLKNLKDKLEAGSDGSLSVACRATTNSFLGEIEMFNKKKDIFAMVMGTSGAGATEAFFLGSFSHMAAKHLSHPLIVVPPGYRFDDIRKIGLACDMHNVTETVPFPAIKALFEHFDAKLEILYVSKSNEKMYPQVLTETKFVQNSLARLHPEIHITTNDDTKEGLEDFVHKSALDLLILLPRERNFVERIFHRSITRQMVLHPKVPVMILHG
jgi:nucleotide-binding universal stress UspA family protein